VKQNIDKIKRIQQLAGIINEDQSQLSQEGVNAAITAKKAIEILRRQSAVNTDKTIDDIFVSTINVLNTLIP